VTLSYLRHKIIGIRYLFSKERNDPGLDGSASQLAVSILGDESRSDLDLVSDLENTLQDAAAGHTTFQVVHLGTRLVDIERAIRKKMMYQQIKTS
jgi:hypothetical protein